MFVLIFTFVVLLPKKNTLLPFYLVWKKAYDTTQRYGTPSDLYDLDLRGHLPTFIDGFQSHRLFQVKVGSKLFDTYEQEMSVL